MVGKHKNGKAQNQVKHKNQENTENTETNPEVFSEIVSETVSEMTSGKHNVLQSGFQKQTLDEGNPDSWAEQMRQLSHMGQPRQIVLLGNPDTKRTNYLVRAADEMELPLLFLDWKHWKEEMEHLSEKELFLKIDPPLWESCSLEEMSGLIREYVGELEELYHMGEPLSMEEPLQAEGQFPITRRHKVEFFNHPLAIADLLDKRVCKGRLQKAGLPVTETLEIVEEFSYADPGKRSTEGKRNTEGQQEKLSVERLLKLMREQGIYQVFIKPVNGSGAAGVSAFRWQPSVSRMALYTCALMDKAAGLVNTKRLRRFSEPKEVMPLLDGILDLDCIIERWYAKADYQGLSYDLRAVVQEGCLDFLLGRLSQGPITNLHLNNRPLEASALGLPLEVLDSVADMCKRAMACFPGLRSAGIDILLEKGSLNPRIIEMNGQGDLMYQDIYHENRIYRHQAEIMRRWLLDGKEQ